MFDGTNSEEVVVQGSVSVFQASLLARPAAVRVAVVAVGLVPLWLAIAWAVAVP
jgi:hypothetical protein